MESGQQKSGQKRTSYLDGPAGGGGDKEEGKKDDGVKIDVEMKAKLKNLLWLAELIGIFPYLFRYERDYFVPIHVNTRSYISEHVPTSI